MNVGSVVVSMSIANTLDFQQTGAVETETVAAIASCLGYLSSYSTGSLVLSSYWHRRNSDIPECFGMFLSMVTPVDVQMTLLGLLRLMERTFWHV